MFFVELFLVAYILVAALATVMAYSAVDSKTFRVVFIFLGMAMPVIFFYAAIKSLLERKPMPRFNEAMASVEDEIEAERLRIFGGERTCPSFGDRWRQAYEAYLEKLVGNAAKAQERLASLGFHIRNIGHTRHIGRAA